MRAFRTGRLFVVTLLVAAYVLAASAEPAELLETSAVMTQDAEYADALHEMESLIHNTYEPRFAEMRKKGIFKSIGKGLKKVGGGIAKGAKAVGRGIKKGAQAVGRGIKKVGKGAWNGVKAVGRGVKKVGKALWKGGKTVAKVAGVGLLAGGALALGAAAMSPNRAGGFGYDDADANGQYYDAYSRAVGRDYSYSGPSTSVGPDGWAPGPRDSQVPSSELGVKFSSKTPLLVTNVNWRRSSNGRWVKVPNATYLRTRPGGFNNGRPNIRTYAPGAFHRRLAYQTMESALGRALNKYRSARRRFLNGAARPTRRNARRIRKMEKLDRKMQKLSRKAPTYENRKKMAKAAKKMRKIARKVRL